MLRDYFEGWGPVFYKFIKAWLIQTLCIAIVTSLFTVMFLLFKQLGLFGIVVLLGLSFVSTLASIFSGALE